MKRNFKRVLSAALAFVMVFLMIPGSVMIVSAESDNDDEKDYAAVPTTESKLLYTYNSLKEGSNIEEGEGLFPSLQIFNRSKLNELINAHASYTYHHKQSGEMREGQDMSAFAISAGVSLSQSVGANIGVEKLFKLSAEKKFGIDVEGAYSQEKSSYFYEYGINVEKGHYYFDDAYLYKVRENPSTYLSEIFLQDITGDMTPEEFFDKYGTHIVTSYTAGGKAGIYASSTTIETGGSIDVNAYYSSGAGGSATTSDGITLGADKSLEIEAKVRAEIEKKTFLGKTDYYAWGGDSSVHFVESNGKITFNYQNWADSLKGKNSMILIDDRLQFVPIWSLIPTVGNEDRILELTTYFMKMSEEQDNDFYDKFGIDASEFDYSKDWTTFENCTIITNEEELNDIRNDLNGVYVLANNITLSKYANWTPIGTKEAPFTGRLYGNYNTIYGLNMSSDISSDPLDTTLVGLFGCNEGLITDVKLSGNISMPEVTKANVYVGAIAAYNRGIVNNCVDDVLYDVDYSSGKYVNLPIDSQAVAADKTYTIGDSLGVHLVGQAGSTYSNVNIVVEESNNVGPVYIILEDVNIVGNSANGTIYNPTARPIILISRGTSNSIKGAENAIAVNSVKSRVSILGDAELTVTGGAGEKGVNGAAVSNGNDGKPGGAGKDGCIAINSNVLYITSSANVKVVGGSGGNGGNGSSGDNAAWGDDKHDGGAGGKGGNGSYAVFAERIVVSSSNVEFIGGNGGNGGNGGKGGEAYSNGKKGNGGNGGKGGDAINCATLNRYADTLEVKGGNGGSGGSGNKNGTAGAKGSSIYSDLNAPFSRSPVTDNLIITDTGYYGAYGKDSSGNKYTHAVDLSKYRELFKSDIKFTFVINITLSEINDGYQEVHLYKQNTVFEDIKENDQSIAESHGWIAGNDKLADGKGLDTSIHSHNVVLTVTGDKLADKIYLRYDANGADADNWRLRDVSVKVYCKTDTPSAFATQIVDGSVPNVLSGIVCGTNDDGKLRLSKTEKWNSNILQITSVNKTEYFSEDEFDFSKIEVQQDGQVISNYGKKFDFSCRGSQLSRMGYVEITKGEFVRYIPVHITKTIPDYIEVSEVGKTEFVVGETFDISGLKVKVVYNDGSEEYITEADITYTTPSTEFVSEAEKVVVTYQASGMEFSDEYEITVVQNPVESIAINNLPNPNNLKYKQGEELRLDGLQVYAVKKSGERILLDNEELKRDIDIYPSLCNVGTSTVTINYGGFSKSFSVTVEAVNNFEHPWEDVGTVTLEPTHTSTGTMIYRCTVDNCDATKTTDIEPTSQHDFGNWTSYNETQHVKTCECGESEYADHNYPEVGTETLAPTYTEKGVMTYSCTVCGYAKTESIPPLGVENVPTIVIESDSIVIGSTVDVRIKLKNNPGIASMKFALTYDTEVLTLTNVVYNSAIGGQAQQPQNYNSPVILNWINGTADSEGDFLFATLTFTVKSDAVAGELTTISLTYDENDVYDISETNIEFYAPAFNEQIKDYISGDMNGDNVVNNKDMTRLFQYLSGWDVEANEAALDINGDGAINNKDLTRLFQYLSGWNVEIH